MIESQICPITGFKNYKSERKYSKGEEDYFFIIFGAVIISFVIIGFQDLLVEDIGPKEIEYKIPILLFFFSISLLVTLLFHKILVLNKMLDFQENNESNRSSYNKKLAKLINKLCDENFFDDTASLQGMNYRVKSTSGLHVYIEYENGVSGEYNFWDLVKVTHRGEERFSACIKNKK